MPPLYVVCFAGIEMGGSCDDHDIVHLKHMKNKLKKTDKYILTTFRLDLWCHRITVMLYLLTLSVKHYLIKCRLNYIYDKYQVYLVIFYIGFYKYVIIQNTCNAS